MKPRLPRIRIRRDFLAVAIAALVVYIPGFWWGAPHATDAERKQSWGVDDETPLGPLAEIHNIIEPKPDRNLGYPLMYSFMTAGAYSPYLAFLKITGQWGQISGEYPFGLSDPVTTLKVMSGIAHFLTVLMSMGIAVAAYETGRVMKNRTTGVLTTLFTMTSFPMFYYGRTGNVDVPMLFFLSLTLMMFAHCLVHGFTVRRAIFTGVFAGFALGTKEQAIVFLLAIPFVLLVVAWREHCGRWRTWEFWRAPAGGGIASIIAFGFGSGLFIEPGRYIAHVEFALNVIGTIAEGDIYIPYVFPRTWEGNLGYLVRAWEVICDMITLPGALLGIIGMIWIFVTRPKAIGVAVVVVVFVGITFYLIRTPQLRYFLPMGLLLGFPAAWLVAVLQEHRAAAVRWGAMGVAAGVIGFNLLRGIELTHQMINDSRFEAAAWLADRTEPGDRIEFFGSSQKLPPLEEGVSSIMATEYRGIYHPLRQDDAKVAEILQGWAERNPRYIIVIPDITSRPGVEHSSACPPQLYQAMLEGSHGHVLEAQFKTKPLFPFLRLPDLDYPSVNPPIRVFSLAGNEPEA